MLINDNGRKMMDFGMAGWHRDSAHPLFGIHHLLVCSIKSLGNPRTRAPIFSLGAVLRNGDRLTAFDAHCVQGILAAFSLDPLPLYRESSLLRASMSRCPLPGTKERPRVTPRRSSRGRLSPLARHRGHSQARRQSTPMVWPTARRVFSRHDDYSAKGPHTKHSDTRFPCARVASTKRRTTYWRHRRIQNSERFREGLEQTIFLPEPRYLPVSILASSSCTTRNRRRVLMVSHCDS